MKNLLWVLSFSFIMLLSACGPAPVNKKNAESADELALNQESGPFSYLDNGQGIGTMSNVDSQEGDSFGDDTSNSEDETGATDSGTFIDFDNLDDPGSNNGNLIDLFPHYSPDLTAPFADLKIVNVTLLDNNRLSIRVHYDGVGQLYFTSGVKAVGAIAQANDPVTGKLHRVLMPITLGGLHLFPLQTFDFVYDLNKFKIYLEDIGSVVPFEFFKTFYLMVDPNNQLIEHDELNNHRVFFID